MTKECILTFPNKGNLEKVKNYRGIIFTLKAAKIYNTLLHKRIESEIEKVLRKNQNGFWRKQSTI